LVVLLVAGFAAWQLWPVQILVTAYRLTHLVAANRPVHWAEGPRTAPSGERPPNIVLIVADDLGINDITSEGPGRGVASGLVQTPNIDAIAREGADFTVAYAANATCSPSRAALMTGRYPPRFGFEFTAVPDQLAKYVPRYSPKNRPHPTIYHADLQAKVPPMADMGMPASEVTIAEVLKARGYHTIHLGKWHLGESKGMRPEDQGFDESLGFMPGASKYEADTAGPDARLPGDPLDRFLWLALSDGILANPNFAWDKSAAAQNHYERHYVMGNQGDLSATINELQQAFDINPDPDLVRLQAQYLQSAGLYQQAIDLLRAYDPSTRSSLRRFYVDDVAINAEGIIDIAADAANHGVAVSTTGPIRK